MLVLLYITKYTLSNLTLIRNCPISSRIRQPPFREDSSAEPWNPCESKAGTITNEGNEAIFHLILSNYLHTRLNTGNYENSIFLRKGKNVVNKALILLTETKFLEFAFSGVAGTPLFKRIILSGQKAGIDEFFILCTGKRRPEIESYLYRDKRIRSKINIMNFPDHGNEGEGIYTNVLNTFDQNYLIINGNTIFDYRLIQELSQTNLKDAMGAVTIDKRNNAFSENQNEWYVKLSNDNIMGISQDLENYDGRVTGIMLASPGTINILTESLLPHPSFSLYEWIKSQIIDEKLIAVDIKDNLCVEIASKSQLQECERLLYNSLGAIVDGPIVDKYINRRISRHITRQLVKTPVTPNQTTLLSLIIGIVSAWFFWQGGYWNYLAGGLIFQFSFIFDQCDGEIARLKFMESKFGGWFDAICDSIIRAFMVSGMTRSLYIESDQLLILILGILSSIGIFVSTILSSYETLKEEDIKCTNRKSAIDTAGKGNKLSAFVDKFNNTDSFSIILFICIFSGQLVWFLWTIGIGSFAFSLAILAKSLLVCRKKT